MSVSKIQPIINANNFTLDIGSTGNDTFVFSKEYAPGTYSITSQLSDMTLDVYAISSDGSLAGYTNTKSFIATKGFNKIVVYGSLSNDLLEFVYKTTYLPSGHGNLSSGVAPYLSSISESSLTEQDSSTIIYGGNFSEDVQVVFKGINDVELPAKTITVTSSNQLTATRPDDLDPTYNPYTIIARNPGIVSPSIGNNILLNAVSSGDYPVWQTPSILGWIIGVTASIQLSATDPDDNALEYEVVSGTIPSGLSMSTSGLISGDPGTSELSQNFTVRVTDSGGNYLDRAFVLYIDNVPVWITAAGALAEQSTLTATNIQLAATGNTVGESLTYSIVSGSMQPGLSLSTSGLISGTATAGGTSSFTVRAADSYGGYSDRSFTIKVNAVIAYYSSGTFSVPQGISSVAVLLVAGGGNGYAGYSNSGGGGGGAGGVLYNSSYAVTPGASIAVGIGGSSSSSTFGTLTAASGGAGASYGSSGGNGGSGGGSVRNSGYGSGVPGQGSRGGYSTQSFNAGCGGGGKNASGGDLTSSYQDAAGGNGIYINTFNSLLPNVAVGGGGGGGNWSNGGDVTSRAAGGLGGGGYGGMGTSNTSNNAAADGTPNTGGGGGGGGGRDTGQGGSGGNGGSGVCYIVY